MAEELNIYQKLSKAQNTLKAPKGQYNKFGKYKYRSAEDILEAAKPVNQENGLLLTISDQLEVIGDRYYIKAVVELINFDNPNEKITKTAYARESLSKKGMDESQISGTASSYARKYALNGLYLIDDTKDADTDEYHQNTQQKTKSQNKSKQPVKSQDPENKVVDKINQGYKMLEDELAMTTDQTNNALKDMLKVDDLKKANLDDILKGLRKLYGDGKEAIENGILSIQDN